MNWRGGWLASRVLWHLHLLSSFHACMVSAVECIESELSLAMRTLVVAHCVCLASCK